MDTPAANQPGRSRSRVLLALTTVYGALYVLFMATNQYGSSGAEPTVVKFLFAVFLVGYVLVWIHEALGGIVFVLWWFGMWYLALFVAQEDPGNGVSMGVPLLVLGVLFIVGWYKRRRRPPAELVDEIERGGP